MTQDFKSQWVKHFQKVCPLGFLLRQAYTDRWTRFHALPKSQRSAENQFQMRTILHRAGLLGDCLFPPLQDIWLVSGVFGSFKPKSTELKLAGIKKPALFQTTFAESSYGDTFDEMTRFHVYALKTHWRECNFNPLLEEIASDNAFALFFEPRSGRVLAPYDGGFDIIVESRFRVLSLERRFKHWMSDLECKL